MNVSKPRPIIALTTDFGLADHYVGTMKAVLLGRCPEAHLVDITHDIPSFSIESGAYALDQAAPFFPSGTVHLVVIDPGVGTRRKPLCIEALDQIFVAPDNGVLTLITLRDSSFRARELTNRDLWLPAPSSTFHGRDIFSPVAAALASGSATPADVGPLVSQIAMLDGLQVSRAGSGAWQGKVLSIDRFGNIITNFKIREFSRISTTRFAIKAKEHSVELFCSTFSEAPRGVCFAFFGSSGFIELGVNQQCAAALLGLAPGDPLQLISPAAS